MRKRLKRDHTYVDTGYLRDHVSKLREERKIAVRLYDNVAAMKRCDDPNKAYQYNSILRDINQMIQYFDRMSSILSNVCDDAVHLSHELGNIIENDTERTRRITSDTFML